MGEGSRERHLISLFLALHLAASFALLTPGLRLRQPSEPIALGGPLRLGGRSLRLVTEVYMDVTATRQDLITLGATRTIEWTPSLRVIAFYSGSGGVGQVVADTILLRDRPELSFPLRFSRMHPEGGAHAGPEDWAEFYRPFFAGGLCLSLTDSHGQRPAALEVRAEWERRSLPWRPQGEADRRIEDLGRYLCSHPADWQGGRVA